MPANRKVALVIGSGAVKCVASLGLLTVLERESIGIDLLVGCSGGSLYAAAMALGYGIDRQTALTHDLWKPEMMQGFATNLASIRSGEKRFTERSGLADDTLLNSAYETAFGDTTFADTIIPLYMVATDFMNGEQVLLTEGSIKDAVRASSAIPTIFPPWEIGGRLLVDGATTNPLPIDIAIQQGADIIIAMGFELEYRPRMRSMTAVNMHLNNIFINTLLRSNQAFYTLAHHHEILLMIPQFDRPISAFETNHIPYIIEQGSRIAEEELPYLKKLIAAD